MANEVRVSTTYSFSLDGTSLNGSNSVSYSISGTNAIGNIQAIASGVSSPINFGNLGDVRYCHLINQSTGLNCNVSLNSGQTQVFSLMRPGESILIMPTGSGIWVSGIGGGLDLSVLANES